MLKRFDFFTRSLITSDGIALDYRALSPSQLSHTAFGLDDFTCCCAGENVLVLGDARGGITVMSSTSLRPKRFTLLDETPPVFMALRHPTLLLTCSPLCQIHVFKLASHEDEAPKLVCTLPSPPLAFKRMAVPGVPTAFAVNKSVSEIGIGFSNGHVLWVHGVSLPPLLLSEKKVMAIEFLGSITSLAFLENSLVVSSAHRVSSFDFDLQETCLDQEMGCLPLCGAKVSRERFVAVREDRVQFFSSESPGSCYSLPGQKVSVTSQGDNLVVAFSNHSIQILDFSLKLLAHEFSLMRGDGIAFLTVDDASSSVFVLTKMKKLWRISEKSLDTRLDEFLRRNLYSMAIQLATTSNKCELSFIADMYRRFGDHLYEKRNFDDAMMQYLHTIGRVEPSYIIKRFLEANRVSNLVAYLEALHANTVNNNNYAHQMMPTRNHTTLLLTCYAKLKQEDKIAKFIQTRNDSEYDVSAALDMLRETGRIVPALELAKAKRQSDWYVSTLLDMANPSSVHHAIEALRYIQVNRLEDMFLKHAFVLCTLLPNETLACAQEWLLLASSSSSTVDKLLDAFLPKEELTYALCLFLFHQPELVDAGFSPRVWNTCLEVSLSHKNFTLTQELIRHPRALFDVSFALHLLAMHGDIDSQVLLFEKYDRMDELLALKLKENHAQEILTLALEKFPENAQCWTKLLVHFSTEQSPVYFLRETLAHIDQHDLLPPLFVLKVLSESSSTLCLGTVRSYVTSQMERAIRQAQTDKAEVGKLREEIESMNEERHALETEPRLFNATVCALTGNPLELPVVHFMSGNSYNLNSLPANTAGGKLHDPKCVQEQNAVFDIAQGLARRRIEVDEEFFSELQQIRGGEAGFSFVAEYFGKCLFDDENDDHDLEEEEES